MNEYTINQISIFEALEPGHKSEQAQASAKDALTSIIRRVENSLIERGRPCGWVSATADPHDKYSIFLPRGLPHYPSACPHYQGFWLNGCRASVQCALHDGMIPGVIWDEVCKHKGGVSCPLKSHDTPLSVDS